MLLVLKEDNSVFALHDDVLADMICERYPENYHVIKVSTDTLNTLMEKTKKSDNEFSPFAGLMGSILDLTTFEYEDISGEYLIERMKKEGAIYILNDVNYKISLTSDDAVGLMQIKTAFDLGVTNTVLHCANGTKVPLTPPDLMPLAQWFTQKRNQFFVQ
jgi:hypothetical protein